MLPVVVDSIEGMDSAIVACCECALSFVIYSMVSQPIVAKLENEKKYVMVNKGQAYHCYNTEMVSNIIIAYLVRLHFSHYQE